MKKEKIALAVFMAVLVNLCMPTVVMATKNKNVLGAAESLPKQANDADILLIEDYDTGAFLCSKNADTHFSMIGGVVLWMTAKIAAEKLISDEMVEVDFNLNLSSSSRKIGLKKGSKLSVRDLLAALLLYGAQDAAVVLAQKAAGSASAFVILMNEEAKRLGMTQTNYTNPFGTLDSNQYTTATDFMLFAKSVFENAVLRDIISMDEYTLSGGSTLKNKKIENRCTMMNPKDSTFDSRIDGAAVGNTNKTGSVNAYLAESGDSQAIMLLVTGKTIDQTNGMAHALLDYCFTFKKIDMTEYAKELAEKLTIQTKEKTVTAFAIKEGDSLQFSAYPEFVRNFDKMQLKMVVDEGSMTNNIQQNEEIASAGLFYQTIKLTDLKLIAKRAETAAPASSDNTQPVATILSVTPPIAESAMTYPINSMDRFGWIIWIAVSGILAILIVFLCKYIRRKMY